MLNITCLLTSLIQKAKQNGTFTPVSKISSYKHQILMVLLPLNTKPHQSSQMLVGFCVGA